MSICQVETTMKEQVERAEHVTVERRFGAARWMTAAGNWGRFLGAIATATVVASLSIVLAVAQQGPAGTASESVRGTVRDGAGLAVSDASVRLEHAGVAAMETQTNAEGGFAFDVLPAGTYTVTAAKAGRHSAAIIVNTGGHEGGRTVTLTLEDNRAAKPGSDSSAPAMEFADNPNFTIAAVTDWTAAGGHGSDAVLRTSEALNREALTLKPGETGSGPASASGDLSKTESALREGLANAPADFEANRKLGEFYLREQRFAEALPPLQAAYRIAPHDSRGEYDLALALTGKGDLSEARDHVQKLLAGNENAGVHRLAGEIDEKLNDPLAAVHEFERAVREDPSEQNYFEWGSELLLHRAVWQAKDVFSAGVKAYPKSERMLTALGAALFAGALYDESAQRLCEASDLNPSDPEPYTFMGKIEMAAPNPLPCVEQKLARFVELRPADPLANYFYAMTVWKQKGQTIDAPTLDHVQDLLTKAVTIDPKCSDAYLQLGVLQSTRRDYCQGNRVLCQGDCNQPANERGALPAGRGLRSGGRQGKGQARIPTAR